VITFGTARNQSLTSRAAVAYRLDELTQGLRETLKTLLFGAMPIVMQRNLVRNKYDSAHIAANRTAGNLSHGLSVTSRSVPRQLPQLIARDADRIADRLGRFLFRDCSGRCAASSL
jgi:hypothetical protein